MQRILLADHKELELVEDEIAAGDKTFGVPDGDAIREDLNRDVARKIIHELSDDLGLVAADVGGRCAHLPIDVAPVELLRIRDFQMADTEPCKP